MHHLDSGDDPVLDGLETECRSPRPTARFAGIETVYQDLALFDNLTPAQNFFAGREIAGPAWLPRGLRFLSKRRWTPRPGSSSAGSRSRCPSCDVVVAKMSGGQRQAIAVARSTVFALQGGHPRRARRRRSGLQRVPPGAQPRRLLLRDPRQCGDPDHPATWNTSSNSPTAPMVLRLEAGKVGELMPNSSNKQELVAMISRGLDLNLIAGRPRVRNWPRASIGRRQQHREE